MKFHVEWIDDKSDSLGRRSFFANWVREDGLIRGQAFRARPEDFAAGVRADGHEVAFPGEPGHMTWEQLLEQPGVRRRQFLEMP